MIEQIEGLTDEVLFLVEKSDDGLTLGDLYDASVLADSQQAVAGAVHRLTSRGALVRSTDKRVRTKGQAARSAAQPPAPGRQSATEKARERKTAKKPERKAAKKKWSAKLTAPQQQSGETPAKEDATDQARIESAAQAHRESIQRTEDEVREMAEELFNGHEAESDRRFTAQVRGLPVVTESLVEDLEQASVDSQVRLDRYLSQLDDPLLDYLIEAASAAKSVAEAARRVADGVDP